MPSMEERKCKNCGCKFIARTADVKRGWAKFCSKSCKAIKQESRTGQYREYKAIKVIDPEERIIADAFENMHQASKDY